MLEEEKNQEQSEEEVQPEQDQTKPGKEKHLRLEEENFIESQNKEKYRDFRKGMLQKGKHLFDKRKKDKFLGGVKGRRGG